jgi:hypothetical protein
MPPKSTAQLTKKIICGEGSIICEGREADVFTIDFEPPLSMDELKKLPKEGTLIKKDGSEKAEILTKMHFIRQSFGWTERKTGDNRKKAFEGYANRLGKLIDRDVKFIETL